MYYFLKVEMQYILEIKIYAYVFPQIKTLGTR
jgi:hypothetical protein